MLCTTGLVCGIFHKVHVEFLHVVPFHVKQVSIAWRIGRLCEQGILNPNQELGHALPSLVAFVGVLGVEGRQNVTKLHHATKHMQAIVGGRQALHVFNHRLRTTRIQLEQVGLVAVAKLIPSEVGASVSNRQSA